jgi:hypothetical protein
MKKFIVCIILSFLATGYCEARSFGCFAGVLGASNERDIEIDYNHYQIFSRHQHTTEFLPFIGCGVSFDF